MTLALFPDDLENMMQHPMATTNECRSRKKAFTFQDGGLQARSAGIKDQVIMCPKCHKIYEVEVTPAGVILRNDVTSRYKRWWQFWK